MSEAMQATASEELGHALAMPWSALAPLVPWGDRFTGIAVDGRDVEIERSYIWAEEPGGDILCEVIVYAGETRYDHGARVSALIRKP